MIPKTLPEADEVSCILRWKKGSNYYAFLTSEGLIQFSFLNSCNIIVLFSLADSTVYMRDDMRVLVDCSLSTLRRAIGALTRIVQPEVIRTLAFCIDAIPCLIEDDDNPRSSEECSIGINFIFI